LADRVISRRLSTLAYAESGHEQAGAVLPGDRW
jgi:hypothetical protein